MKDAGFSAWQLKAGHFLLQLLQDAGFSPDELTNPNNSLQQLALHFSMP